MSELDACRLVRPGEGADDEDIARAAAVVARRDALLMSELRRLAPAGGYDREFLRLAPESYNEVDRAVLRRLAWHYRRRLPAYLRPAMNPADPVVRERETAHG